MPIAAKRGGGETRFCQRPREAFLCISYLQINLRSLMWSDVDELENLFDYIPFTHAHLRISFICLTLPPEGWKKKILRRKCVMDISPCTSTWLIWDLHKCWYSFLYLVLRWFHMCRVLNRTAQRRMSSVDCTVQHVEKRKIAQNQKESKERKKTWLKTWKKQTYFALSACDTARVNLCALHPV